jgi:uncharacterized protein YndB with AHSA1/START domain
MMTYGTLERLTDDRAKLRFTRSLHHPPDKVWRAITEPEHLATWFPSTIEGSREPGAPLRFTFPGAANFSVEGEMIIFEPPRVMEFRWGTDLLRFELRPTPTGTQLTLIDTFDELGKAARDGAGWHVSLAALELHLSAAKGEASSRDAMNNWPDVHRHYVETFGPEASTIGPPPTESVRS